MKVRDSDILVQFLFCDSFLLWPFLGLVLFIWRLKLSEMAGRTTSPHLNLDCPFLFVSSLFCFSSVLKGWARKAPPHLNPSLLVSVVVLSSSSCCFSSVFGSCLCTRPSFLHFQWGFACFCLVSWFGFFARPRHQHSLILFLVLGLHFQIFLQINPSTSFFVFFLFSSRPFKIHLCFLQHYLSKTQVAFILIKKACCFVSDP